MNDKTKTNAATGLVLYRVNYQFVAKGGLLRQGSLVVEAKDITEAQRIAPERVQAICGNSFRISKVLEF